VNKYQWARFGGTAAFLVMAITAVALWNGYQSFLSHPVLDPPMVRLIEIHPGDGLRSVVGRLHPKARSLQKWYWSLLAWQHDAARRIKVGEYEITPEMRPETLLENWLHGRVKQYRFTIVEGWTFHQLRQALASNPMLSGPLDDQGIASLLRESGYAGQNPEGLFLPETYLFPRNFSRMELLRRSALAMNRTLARTWEARDIGLPLKSPYQVLILASIVEKETAHAEERARIAGVFANRLRRGMRLETDPTVIYGLGDAFQGNLRRQDLRRNTPYNTYTNSGLPPTPICLPGKASLLAAARPDGNEFFYFVARGDGSHQFSKTFAQHSSAVRRYQMKKRDRTR